MAADFRLVAVSIWHSAADAEGGWACNCHACGYRLLDVQLLDETLREHFACPTCNKRAVLRSSAARETRAGLESTFEFGAPTWRVCVAVERACRGGIGTRWSSLSAESDPSSPLALPPSPSSPPLASSTALASLVLWDERPCGSCSSSESAPLEPTPMLAPESMSERSAAMLGPASEASISCWRRRRAAAPPKQQIA